MEEKVLNDLSIFAFTHKHFSLEEIGRLHLDDSTRKAKLQLIKEQTGLSELLYLSTCNRVELVCVTSGSEKSDWNDQLIKSLLGEDADESRYLAGVQHYHGLEAARHFLMVASSLDSLVIGEREIITQTRDAYERCKAEGLTADTVRLLVKKAVEAAKDIFTSTQIAHKPVSVVSLAYRMLRQLHASLDARFLIIGAGQTNTAMARYLKKHGYKNFTVFNRTLSRAEELARETGGKAYPLDQLATYSGGFDVIITCTGASTEVITPEIYRNLIGGETDKKIVIDLAIPFDFNRQIAEEFAVHLVEITSLREMADENLRQRQGEIEACHLILDKHLSDLESLFRQRVVELAMKDVPVKIREIRDRAINGVFARDLEKLDDNSREVLDKVLEYMEKKYISVPMKMAREILAGEKSR